MPHDKENNIIFIHVPKTAGTSIQKKLFSRQFGGHSTISDYLNDDTKAADQFVFSVVRDPYERFYSFYCNHIVRKGRTDDFNFTLEGFNTFVIKTYARFVSDVGKKLIIKDKEFLEWAKRDHATIRQKVCKNIYGYYYNNDADTNIRFLLFENIKEEYHILIQALKAHNIHATSRMNTSNVLYEFNKSRHWAAQKSTIPAILINELESGYNPIKEYFSDDLHLLTMKEKHEFKMNELTRIRLKRIATATAGRAKCDRLLQQGRGSYHQAIKEIEANMSKPDVKIMYSDLYTPEAKEVFEELNSKDVDFYNKLKLISAEDRIKSGINFTEFYNKG